jgi:hypothetical protein
MQNTPATKKRAAAIAGAEAVLETAIVARAAKAASADLVRKARAARVLRASAVRVPKVKAAGSRAATVAEAAVDFAGATIVAAADSGDVKNVVNCLRFRPSM